MIIKIDKTYIRVYDKYIIFFTDTTVSVFS